MYKKKFLIVSETGQTTFVPYLLLGQNCSNSEVEAKH